MTRNIRVLLIGDDKEAMDHPLELIEKEMEQILAEGIQVTAPNDYEYFARLDTDEYDVYISYTDCWRRDLTAEQTSGLLRFVAGGGGLLVIHNGIFIQRSYELSQVITLSTFKLL
jgi:hypothetical protein